MPLKIGLALKANVSAGCISNVRHMFTNMIAKTTYS